MLLERRLKRAIHRGRLTVILPNGRVIEGGEHAPSVEADILVRLHKRSLPWELAVDPARYVPEGYVNGDYTIERGNIFDLLRLLAANRDDGPARPRPWLDRVRRWWMSPWIEGKSRGGARGDAIYRHFQKEVVYQAFLGKDDPQFSVAYFDGQHRTVESAQAAARRHMAAKLRLEAGQHVLDLGGGWGGFAIWLARTFDVEVTAFVLASEQLTAARERIRRAGLADRIHVAIGDYHDIAGQFDRILALGSFEHVGSPQYGDYFISLARALKPDGIALIHSTGRQGEPQLLNAWVRRHMFPGTHIPSLSEVTAAVERSGLWLTDLEVLRTHGAQTIRSWREAFSDRAWEVSDRDLRLERTWEFFLASAELAFDSGELMTFEAQLTRSLTATPITRDYMVETERRLAGVVGAETVTHDHRHVPAAATPAVMSQG